MIIQVTANLKLDNYVVIKAGRYDDRNVPFHPRLYEFIEKGSRHIKVIQADKKEVAQEDAPAETMVDEGEDVTELGDEKPKKSSAKKKSSTSKRSRKSE